MSPMIYQFLMMKLTFILLLSCLICSQYLLSDDYFFHSEVKLEKKLICVIFDVSFEHLCHLHVGDVTVSMNHCI